MKTYKNPPTVSGPYGQYSHAVTLDVGTGTLIFTAGQVALDLQGNLIGQNDPAAQADCAFKNVIAVLEGCGASVADIIKTTIYLIDINAINAVLDVVNGHLGDNAPTSTVVEINRLASPDLLLEIEVVAAVGKA